MIQYQEGMTDSQEHEAHGILEVLNLAYPNHPWYVRVYNGGFFIRHMDFPSTWGMNYRSGQASYSSSALKRQIILMAGEWLERCNLKRGMGDGEQKILHAEGVPQKDQPRGNPLPEGIQIVHAEPEIRNDPRPQVEKMISAKDLH